MNLKVQVEKLKVENAELKARLVEQLPVTLMIYLTSEMKEWLRVCARKRETTMSDIVRTCIEYVRANGMD